ncbi:unnamed protein product, partial [Symbiodinium sp. KB8]
VVAVRARRIVSIPESETSQQPKSKTGKLRRDQAATITCREHVGDQKARVDVTLKTPKT